MWVRVSVDCRPSEGPFNLTFAGETPISFQFFSVISRPAVLSSLSAIDVIVRLQTLIYLRRVSPRSCRNRSDVARQRLRFQSEKLRGVVLTAADIFQWPTTGPSACREIFLTRRRAEGDIILCSTLYFYGATLMYCARVGMMDYLGRAEILRRDENIARRRNDGGNALPSETPS